MHTYIQVEEDKGSAEDAMKKLQDALKYMNTDTAATTAVPATPGIIYMHTYIHTFVKLYIHTFVKLYIHTFVKLYVHTHAMKKLQDALKYMNTHTAATTAVPATPGIIYIRM